LPSLFLCNSLSPFSSFSPITCPVLLLFGWGVPSISAGEATVIALTLSATISGEPVVLSPSTRVLVFTPQDLQLPSLLSLLFLIAVSLSLSGDLNTVLALGVASTSSSSESSSNCSLVLFRRHLELERLAWICRLSDWSVLVSGLAVTVCD